MRLVVLRVLTGKTLNFT